MSELIERLRIAAKILRDIGGPPAIAATIEEAAAALEAAREDAERYRWLKAHDNAYLLAEEVIDDQIAIDQARGKGVQGG